MVFMGKEQSSHVFVGKTRFLVGFARLGVSNMFLRGKCEKLVGGLELGLKLWRKRRQTPVIHTVLEKRKSVDGKGRVYLPRTWRRKLGLNEGDEIRLLLMNRWVEVHPAKKTPKG